MIGTSIKVLSAMAISAITGKQVAETTLSEQSSVTIALLFMGIGGAFAVGVILTGIRRDIRQLQLDSIENKRRHNRVDRERERETNEDDLLDGRSDS